MRTAIVTGAASGIGAAIATSLRARGVCVVGLDIVKSELSEDSLICDVTDEALVKETVRQIGEVDIAITAAGYYATTDLVDLHPESWRTMVRVHVEGTCNVLAAVLPGMYRRGRGDVCTIGSELSLIGDPEAPHYAAAKGAVAALTKSIAVEAAPSGVRVNCLAPGPCDTPLLSEAHRSREAIASLPLGRLLTPEEIAAVVVWLVLKEHNLVGQLISPNAGAVL